MPRRPRGLHLSAQSARNTGGRARAPAVVPMEAFAHQVRAPIGTGTAQGLVANDGSAVLAVGPQGVGTRWYPSQVLVSTSSGPSDQSEARVYRDLIDPKQEVGQTQQGGGEVLAFTHDMQPGNLLYVVWARANPGDLVTVTVHGDQLTLSSAPL